MNLEQNAHVEKRVTEIKKIKTIVKKHARQHPQVATNSAINSIFILLERVEDDAVTIRYA